MDLRHAASSQDHQRRLAGSMGRMRSRVWRRPGRSRVAGTARTAGDRGPGRWAIGICTLMALLDAEMTPGRERAEPITADLAQALAAPESAARPPAAVKMRRHRA